MKKAIIAALGLAATLGLSSCSTAASSGGSGQATNFTQLLPMIAIYVLLFAALYFFMIRPNSKKKKQEEQLRNSLEIGMQSLLKLILIILSIYLRWIAVTLLTDLP